MPSGVSPPHDKYLLNRHFFVPDGIRHEFKPPQRKHTNMAAGSSAGASGLVVLGKGIYLIILRILHLRKIEKGQIDTGFVPSVNNHFAED